MNCCIAKEIFPLPTPVAAVIPHPRVSTFVCVCVCVCLPVLIQFHFQTKSVMFTPQPHTLEFIFAPPKWKYLALDPMSPPVDEAGQ